MYESSFGLSDRPFAATPAARRYYPAAGIESARQTVGRCIERAEGAALVVGPAGTGKSILCQALAEQFRGRFSIALLASSRLETRKAFLQSLLFELGLPYRGMDEGELRLALVGHLTAQQTASDGLLLVIDEAQSLPLRLLAEVHQLTNLVRGGQSRVRVVLAGSPLVEEHLGSPKLESFNQRIAARCYLESFQHAETLGYIRRAISQVGGNADQLFTAEALDAVHRATDGVPRLVNQLCDHALLLACAAGATPLTAAVIDEAWADLQQLPAPWNAAPGVESRSADIIEFGSLDEPAVAARISPDDEPRPTLAHETLATPMPHEAAHGPAPRLHAVAADEAALCDESLFAGEPTQRIERIKDRLGSIDEQFQPAGTIGPEVELVLSHAEINPFQEPFEEEEVIVDRFAGRGRDPLAEAPIVRSAEGAELSSMLAPHARAKRPAVKPSAKPSADAGDRRPSAATKFDAPPAPASVALPPATSPITGPITGPISRPLENLSIEVGPMSDAELPTFGDLSDHSSWFVAGADEFPAEMPPIGRAWIHPSEDPVMPEEPCSGESIHRAAGMKPTIPMSRSHSATGAAPVVAMPRREQPALHPPVDSVDAVSGASSPGVENVSDALRGRDEPKCDDESMDDVDVIVIEDDPVPQPSPTASAVRRQEYRQLFARLRRGS